MAQDLWLEDDRQPQSTSSRRRRLGVAAAAVACLLVVAIPVSLVVAGGPGHGTAGSKAGRAPHVGGGQESRHVLTALNATTGSGNFEVSYTFGGQDSSSSTTTTTTACGSTEFDSVATCGGASVVRDQPVTGSAIVDVQPFAMVATSEVSGFGTIVLRDDGTDVWEEGGGDYGLSPGSTDAGPGSLLTGFAGLVEGTLGPRQGALAMLGLASPTGYLDLDPAETGNADLVGTSTVDGAAVTIYQISMTPAQGEQVPGLTAQEQQATSDALAVLSTQGYTGSTVRISIDGAGYIRRTQTTDHFADGTIMTSEAEFSNFGCAGTVVMPGQSGAAAAPVGCTSPDDPSSASPATVTPTTVPSTTVPPTTVLPAVVTPTTAPSNGPTTAVPPSTTSPPVAPSTTIGTPTSPPPSGSTPTTGSTSSSSP